MKKQTLREKIWQDVYCFAWIVIPLVVMTLFFTANPVEYHGFWWISAIASITITLSVYLFMYAFDGGCNDEFIFTNTIKCVFSISISIFFTYIPWWYNLDDVILFVLSSSGIVVVTMVVVRFLSIFGIPLLGG